MEIINLHQVEALKEQRMETFVDIGDVTSTEKDVNADSSPHLIQKNQTLQHRMVRLYQNLYNRSTIMLRNENMQKPQESGSLIK